jgi:hypothetical protein
MAGRGGDAIAMPEQNNAGVLVKSDMYDAKLQIGQEKTILQFLWFSCSSSEWCASCTFTKLEGRVQQHYL